MVAAVRFCFVMPTKLFDQQLPNNLERQRRAFVLSLVFHFLNGCKIYLHLELSL